MSEPPHATESLHLMATRGHILALGFLKLAVCFACLLTGIALQAATPPVEPQTEIKFARGTYDLSPERLDRTLQVVPMNTNPGPEYSDEARDYAMARGIERTPGGRIWAIWVAGGDNDQAFLVATTSDDDGRSWSKPRFVIQSPEDGRPPRMRERVSNFWTDPKGRLWLFYEQSMASYDGRAGLWATTCESPDADNPVWSPPRRISNDSMLNKPIVRRNGEWLLPVTLWARNKISAPLKDSYHELDDQRLAQVFFSSDQGVTWQRRGGVRFPNSDFDEHMLVERMNGDIWMLSRTTDGIGESVSSDGGQTWSEPKRSSIAHVNSRFFVRRLRSGRILLVKHGVTIQARTSSRSHLTAFLSDDEGQTWRGGLLLDERDGVAYPDGFQAPDGYLYITYDRNRAVDREILLARFNEEDILEGRIQGPRSSTKMVINKALGPAK